MANIVNPNLPADLPTDWTTSQYVSPNGSEVSLSQQHGYNYLMEQVNAAQTAVNTLAEQAQEAVSGLESGALTATATRSGTTVAITGPEDAVTVTFLAPADWTEGDSYTYNGTPITVTDLNGSPITDGWKQGAVLTFQISDGVAYFVGGASGSFLPLSGGTMTGPLIGAAGDTATAQVRNIYYGDTELTPGESNLAQGSLYITPGAGSGIPEDYKEVFSDTITVDSVTATLEIYAKNGSKILYAYFFASGSDLKITDIPQLVDGLYFPTKTITFNFEGAPANIRLPATTEISVRPNTVDYSSTKYLILQTVGVSLGGTTPKAYIHSCGLTNSNTFEYGIYTVGTYTLRSYRPYTE